jgi:trigger factor
MDFKGKDDKGQAISGADGNDYPLTLGSNAFIPGFEDNLIGLKAGDEKSFTLTFPKDYGVKALASKKVTFSVTIKTVNELVKPNLDDAYAATVGPFKTLQELKDDIKRQLEQEAKNDLLRDKQNELLGMVVDATKVDIPRELVDQQSIYELDELRRNLTYRGQTFQEFIEMEGTTEQAYKKDVIEPRALQQVKTGVVLSEIAEQEDLNVTPEELEMQMQALKAQYTDPAMQEELEKPETRRDIASRILSQKVVNFITESSISE